MPTNEDDSEQFCSRWRKEVFAFCRMFLGDEGAAEAAACEALVRFCQKAHLSTRESSIPAGLLQAAFHIVQGSTRSGPSATPSPLEAATQLLATRERAVVIMRNLLRMDWKSVAVATDLSASQVQTTWRHAIAQLTQLLGTTRARESH